MEQLDVSNTIEKQVPGATPETSIRSWIMAILLGRMTLVNGISQMMLHSSLIISRPSSSTWMLQILQQRLTHARVRRCCSINFALISSVITAVLVGITHVLTVIYRNYSSVKASSPRLNHFVYAGCYAILFSIATYTVTEVFQSGYGVYSALCNSTVWSVSLGLTIILSTVCAKTWRLYDVFFLSSTEHEH